MSKNWSTWFMDAPGRPRPILSFGNNKQIGVGFGETGYFPFYYGHYTFSFNTAFI